MDTCGVIIASFGDREKWNNISKRALTSVSNQSRQPDEIHRIHKDSLSKARNYGFEICDTDWLCFLDSDDEIEEDYLKFMMDAADSDPGNKNRLLYPRVRIINPETKKENYPDPVVIPKRPLWQGNFMVIGTLISKNIFDKACGFRELIAYEDWDFFLRAWSIGAAPILVRDSIYRYHRSATGRNVVKNPTILYQQIISYNKRWQIDRCKNGETSPKTT